MKTWASKLLVTRRVVSGRSKLYLFRPETTPLVTLTFSKISFCLRRLGPFERCTYITSKLCPPDCCLTSLLPDRPSGGIRLTKLFLAAAEIPSWWRIFSKLASLFAMKWWWTLRPPAAPGWPPLTPQTEDVGAESILARERWQPPVPPPPTVTMLTKPIPLPLSSPPQTASPNRSLAFG